MNQVEDILAHKRKAEMLLAASVYNNPLYARDTIGWLKPNLISDEIVRKFWTAIIDSEFTTIEEGITLATKTAINLKFLNEIMRYSAEAVYFQCEAYAETVRDDDKYIRASCKTNDLAEAIANRDLERINSLAQDITLIPTGEEKGLPNSIDVGLEMLASLDDTVDALDTGLKDLDAAIGGFERETLTILAARPSMGKTALALQLLAHLASHNRTVIYFSLEMARKKLYSRLITHETSIPWQNMRKLDDKQREQVIDANNKLVAEFGNRLIIDDRATLTSRDIWQACNEYKPDVIVVDHLGLVADTEGENNVKRVGNIAWNGKKVAKQFNLSAIYLCQLSRGVTQRDNKRPTMEDLRESGELEQNADLILTLHRQDYYNPQAGHISMSPTELWVVKNRDGARNARIDMVYHLAQQWFYPAQRTTGG